MLLQFVVENVLCFRDRTALSLLAAKGASQDEAHVIRLPGLPPVLKCAAIYGANASGKSNLIKAFELARRLIVDGTKPGEPIPLRRFKLEAASIAAPSRFEFDIHAAGRRYTYGFVATPEMIKSEWLFVNDGTIEVPLFEREHGSEGVRRPTITLGPALTADAARRKLITSVAESTRPSQLFLTECADRQVSELEDVMAWFREGSVVILPSFTQQLSEHRIEQSEEYRTYLGELLKSAGTGISQVTVQAPKDDEQPLSSVGFRKLQERLRVQARLELHHTSTEGGLVPFTLSEESDGTRNLLALAPFLFDLFQPPGGSPTVHILDELNKSLHPLLTRFFVDTFLRTASAAHPGQLIFTTHDSSLLDLSLLPRESIWFIEKDTSGSASLYSLAEMKGEQRDQVGEHLQESYAQGRCGGIPILGDPARLGAAARPLRS
jgi:AAA15 family ATPase/GTPase